MEIDGLIEAIIRTRKNIPVMESALVGISGIDASGKGFVSKHLARSLEKEGYRVEVINADAWLNLPMVRFSKTKPAKHFYEHAFRLDEMFVKLVLPLKRDRSIDLVFDFAEETATAFRPHRYSFQNIDIVLLEGIFIFKKAYVKHFDLKIWIECSFQKALARAVKRSQEELTPSETTKAYLTTYFPAQILHVKTDDPKNAADIIFANNL